MRDQGETFLFPLLNFSSGFSSASSLCRFKERAKGRNHLTLPAHWPRWFRTKSFMVLFKKEPQGLNTWSSPCDCVFSWPDSHTWFHKIMMLKEQWKLSYIPGSIYSTISTMVKHNRNLFGASLSPKTWMYLLSRQHTFSRTCGRLCNLSKPLLLHLENGCSFCFLKLWWPNKDLNGAKFVETMAFDLAHTVVWFQWGKGGSSTLT